MVIFHTYVKLPEGILTKLERWVDSNWFHCCRIMYHDESCTEEGGHPPCTVQIKQNKGPASGHLSEETQVLEHHFMFSYNSEMTQLHLVGGFKHGFYFPCHIWDVIPTPLTFTNSYFSRWLKRTHHQPVEGSSVHVKSGSSVHVRRLVVCARFCCVILSL